MSQVLRGGNVPELIENAVFVFEKIRGYSVSWSLQVLSAHTHITYHARITPPVLCVQVFDSGSFLATADSYPRRTVSTMDDLRAEMKSAKDCFARKDGFVRAQEAAQAGTSAAAQAPKVREAALTRAAEAKTENLSRLRSATSPDAAAAAAAPAQLSAGVELLRRKMTAVKGQPELLRTLETIVKAAERRRRRAVIQVQKRGASSSTQHNNLNMVFYGPPGTGKTSTVEVLAKVFAAREVGLLKSSKVTELNKDTDLNTLIGRGSSNLTSNAQKIGKLFEQSQGATLFIDEVHQRGPAFAKDLLPLLSKYEGKVMVVIAGYYNDVDNWLRTSDPGMISRFPRQGFITFESLPADSLVEIGMATLEKAGYSLHRSANDTFRRVMEHVCARKPAENARGADNEVVAMMTEHDGRDEVDDEDACIRDEVILTACPFAASPPPAAAASSHAPTAAGEGRDGSTPSMPMPAAASTGSGAAASPDNVTADGSAATMDSEEDAPAPTSSGKRKRKADSGDARAEVDLADLSPDASCLAKVILKHYKLDKNADRIPALAFIKYLAGRVPNGVLGDKLDGVTRVALGIQILLKSAFDAINKRNGNIVRLVEDNKTQYVHGLRL